MNINKLAKLAKQDDPVLVVLVNRWMLDKSKKDPIPDALLYAREWVWAWWGSIIILGLFLPLIISDCIFAGHSKIGTWILCIALISLAVFMVSVVWRIRSIDSKISNKSNLFDFCSAISLIERIYIGHNAALDMWQDELKIASTAGRAYFYSMADQLKKLEKVSWRREDAKKLRERLFHKELHLLHALLLIPNDCREYLEPKPEQSPSLTVHEIFEKGALTAH